jgi:toxin ParE1/3/4
VSKLIREIEERFSTVLSNPEIGPRRDRLAKGLRAHFHRDYVLYYRHTDSEVIIVRVVHGARDVQALTFDEDR